MLDFIVSLLYPKKCVKCRKSGSFICDNCLATIHFLESQFCPICQKGSVDGLTHPKCRTRNSVDGILSSLVYKGVVKKLIYQFKYPPYLSSLKLELGRLLYEGLIQQEAFISFISMENCVISFVPLHEKRLRKRGYNQSELLATELSQRVGMGKPAKLLLRILNTKPQFELKKEQRSNNIIGAFTVNPQCRNYIAGKNIILVDDILTTGSTLRECAKIIKKSGAKKVLGVTLAHEVN